MKQRRMVFVYKDEHRKWRWHLVGANNWDVLADSGQGYTERNKAAAMVRSIFSGSKYLLAWRQDGALHTEVIQ